MNGKSADSAANRMKTKKGGAFKALPVLLCLLLSAAAFLLAGCGKKDKDDSFISLGISFGSDEDSYTRSLPSEAADAPVHTARGSISMKTTDISPGACLRWASSSSVFAISLTR